MTFPEAPLRVLTFSTLFPSSARPGHGAFIETRQRALLQAGAVQTRVLAPVAWFPSAHPRFGAWACMAATPRRELRNGLDVLHPRYALPPKVGQTVAPLALALGAWPAVRRLRREGFDFDVIDAHYFYPDGVAAALLAHWAGRPFLITARGSDINLLGRDALARRMMVWAASRAAAAIGVCTDLTLQLHAWGVTAGKLHVLPNGVDLQRFVPQPTAAARARTGLQGAPALLCVGNLVAVKGQALALEALALLHRTRPQATLTLLGDGPLRPTLERQARNLGLAGHVRFAGRVANEELAAWYSAADLTLLPSHSEGWANVLLESLACGTPVVATAVGGSGEVISVPAAGALLQGRDPAAFAALIERQLAMPPDPAAVRRYAEGFAWERTARAQYELLRGAVAQHRAAAQGAPVAAR